MKTQSERIIEKFGGMTSLARLLGHQHPSTVQGWKVRGYIPAKHQETLLRVAREKKIDLEPSDFFTAA